jgi:hypothetical protein
MIKRREFITLLGGATAAWPLAARAQQPDRMRRIGVLMAIAADDPESQARLTAFAQGLKQLGWTAGQDVRIDYRWGGSNADDINKHATELVALAPDVNRGATDSLIVEMEQLTTSKTGLH